VARRRLGEAWVAERDSYFLFTSCIRCKRTTTGDSRIHHRPSVCPGQRHFLTTSERSASNLTDVKRPWVQVRFVGPPQAGNRWTLPSDAADLLGMQHGWPHGDWGLGAHHSGRWTSQRELVTGGVQRAAQQLMMGKGSAVIEGTAPVWLVRVRRRRLGGTVR
jgi:hypothetical protein